MIHNDDKNTQLPNTDIHYVYIVEQQGFFYTV